MVTVALDYEAALQSYRRLQIVPWKGEAVVPTLSPVTLGEAQLWMRPEETDSDLPQPDVAQVAARSLFG